MVNNKIILPLEAKKPRAGDSKNVTSADAHHFAVGSILGDGSISKRDLNLEIESKSATFATWKRDLAKDLGLISVHAKDTTSWELKIAGKKIRLPLTVKNHSLKKTSNTTKRYYRSFSFVTRSVFYDAQWRDSFYEPLPNPKRGKEFRKKVPSNIKELFWSDFALAIWYLDDGTFDPQKGTARLAAGEWTESECELMQECLKDNFNLTTSLYKSNGVPHHFYVKVDSYPEFYKRIKPTIDKLLAAYPKAGISTGLIGKMRLKP